MNLHLNSLLELCTMHRKFVRVFAASFRKKSEQGRPPLIRLDNQTEYEKIAYLKVGATFLFLSFRR